MPSTPLKAVPRGNENTPEPVRSVKKTPGSQRKDPWSRSSPRRFSGHGSIYNTAAAGATPLSNTTPSKQQSSSQQNRAGGETFNPYGQNNKPAKSADIHETDPSKPTELPNVRELAHMLSSASIRRSGTSGMIGTRLKIAG